MTTTISKQEQQPQQQHPQQQHPLHQQYVQLQPPHLVTSDSPAVAIAADLQFDTLNNNNNNNNSSNNNNNSGSPEQALPSTGDERQKRRSLLNFKSLDFHLKSLYSGLRSTSGTTPPASQPNSSIPAVDQPQRRMPYLRVESVDPEEPTRGSVLPGHSPSFLSPYSGVGGGGVSLQLPSSSDGGTIRRSSTSDIVNCRRGGGAGGGAGGSQDSRRPSTSDLLRKARERKGSEARMGRSVSHSGLTRGGPGGGGGGLGGRRTSMAF